MRNKKVKMLAAMLLVTVPLAACSGKNETTGGGTTPQSASPTAAATPLKFSMSINGGDNPYITKVGNLANDKYVQEMNKRANVELDLKVKSHKNYAQEMQLMFASGVIPDLVWDAGDSSSPNVAVAINSGVFMQLDELLEKHKAELPNLMKAIPKEAWEQEKVGGKLYGVPVAYLSTGLNESLYIRKDLLTKYNLKAPTTLDEAVQVMKMFKQNGMKYPYSGREKWSYTNTFIYPFGVATNRWNVLNNEMVPDTIRPEMKEALAYNRKLREEGLMDPETLTTSSTDWTNKIKTGQVGMFTHVPSSFRDWNEGLKAHVPDGEFIIIPALKGSKGAAGAPVSPLISASILTRTLKSRFAL
jgi:putative aldouronate transport system substrate-binding protein